MGIWFGAVAGPNPSAHYVVIRVSIRNFFDILCRNFDYPVVGVPLVIMPLAKGHGIITDLIC